MEFRDTYLAVSGSEGHPSSTRPPSNDEAKEPGVFGTSAFCGPNVDGTAQGKSRTDLGQYSSGDEHEDHGDQIGRPDKQSEYIDARSFMQYLPNGSRPASEKSNEDSSSACSVSYISSRF